MRQLWPGNQFVSSIQLCSHLGDKARFVKLEMEIVIHVPLFFDELRTLLNYADLQITF